MKNKLIMLMALDSLLLELDDNYKAVPEKQMNLIESKVLECYGLTLKSREEELKKIEQLLISDVTEFRDRLIEKLEY